MVVYSEVVVNNGVHPSGTSDPVIRLCEGNFFGCLSDLAQESRISRAISLATLTIC